MANYLDRWCQRKGQSVNWHVFIYFFIWPTNNANRIVNNYRYYIEQMIMSMNCLAWQLYVDKNNSATGISIGKVLVKVSWRFAPRKFLQRWGKDLLSESRSSDLQWFLQCKSHCTLWSVWIIGIFLFFSQPNFFKMAIMVVSARDTYIEIAEVLEGPQSFVVKS